MGIETLISASTLLIGLVVSGKALISKSDLEQVFLTHEQQIKAYYIKLLSLSGLISVLIADCYVLWNLTVDKMNVKEVNWGFAFSLLIITFVCCLFLLGTIERMIQNFCINHHYKYKVTVDNHGDVYILKMMNEELCICSKEPNADYVINNTESYLVMLDDLVNKPLKRERIEKPSRTFWQKFLD